MCLTFNTAEYEIINEYPNVCSQTLFNFTDTDYLQVQEVARELSALPVMQWLFLKTLLAFLWNQLTCPQLLKKWSVLQSGDELNNHIKHVTLLYKCCKHFYRQWN